MGRSEGSALSISFSAPDVASGTIWGEARRFHPYSSSEDASIGRRNGTPTLSGPSLATPKLEGIGGGRPWGLPPLLCTPIKPLPLLLNLDSHLYPHPSLPPGIKCWLHFICKRSFANFCHKLLHIVRIHLQVGFKRPWFQLCNRKHNDRICFRESTPDLLWSPGGGSLPVLGGMPQQQSIRSAPPHNTEAQETAALSMLAWSHA